MNKPRVPTFPKDQADTPCPQCDSTRKESYKATRLRCYECRKAYERWYRQTPESKAAQRRKKARYRKTLKGKAQRRRQAKRYAQQKSIVPNEPWTLEELFKLHGDRCLYCGQPADQQDHVIPISAGGPDMMLNLVPACPRCNGTKQNKLDMLSLLPPLIQLRAQATLAAVELTA